MELGLHIMKQQLVQHTYLNINAHCRIPSFFLPVQLIISAIIVFLRHVVIQPAEVFEFEGNVYSHHLSPIAKKHSLIAGVCTRMPADFYLKQTNAQTRFQGPIAMPLNRISNLSLLTVCSSSSFGPTLTHLHYHWHTRFYTGGITASSFAHSWKAFWSNKSQFTLQHLFR